jgi:hypothetical protein
MVVFAKRKMNNYSFIILERGTGERKQLHNEKLKSLYYSYNISRMAEPRRTT